MGSKAIIYRRVSTEEQAVSGLGLEAQLSACTAVAARLGFTEIEYQTDEGLSAARPPERRPGLIAAIAGLNRGDVLIVQKRDRLVRDGMLAELIDKRLETIGARVISAAGEGTHDDEPSSILVRRIIDDVNDYERLIIKVRTVAALLALRRRGHRFGMVPYGFTLDADKKTLHVAPAEVETVEEIRRRVAAGEPLRRVAADLTRRGVPTKHGRPWSHQSVAKLAASKGRNDESPPSPPS